MKETLFNSYVWKSKVKYENKNTFIETISKEFRENKHRLTPKWGCLVYSSFRDEGYAKIPEDLLNIIRKKISDFVSDFPEIQEIGGEYLLQDSWYNVYENNYYQEPHDHEPATFSGCYYLKFNKKIHHQTVFHNPSFNSQYDCLVDNPYFCNHLECDEDDIIIFPSNLRHGTKGMRDKHFDDLRITISFNIVNTKYRTNQPKVKKLLYK